MDKAWQLVPLFATGFFVSRIVARTGLAESSLQWFFEKSQGRFGRILLALLATTILLSLFIPNMLTVLALLPIVEKLGDHLRELGKDAERLTTPLILALIYGANIGGMGSLIGSPANALLLLFLDLLNVPGRGQINFLSWLLWGVPLVFLFGFIAWGLLVLFLVPRSMLQLKLSFSSPPRHLTHHRLFGTRISLVAVAFWLSLSTLASLFSGYQVLWDGLAVLFGISFTIAVFGLPLPEKDGSRRPLLHWSDCYSGLPWRGLFWAGAAVGVGFLLYQMGLPKVLAAQVKAWTPENLAPFWLYLGLVLISIFATELISNTVASTALLPIAYQLSIKFGYHPLPAMMGVALASTCAFMSPLATPATGLAFGGVRGVSLPQMLTLGLLINLLGGIWLTLLLTYALPWFYGFPLVMPR